MPLLAYIDPTPVVTFGASLAGLLAICGAFLGVILACFRKLRKWMRRNIWKTIFLGCALVVGGYFGGAAIMAAFESEPENLEHQGDMQTDGNRVFLLGLDGLSPDVLEPLMAAGELPNFARLKEMGSYHHLRTTNPSQSPVAWATFATGLNPGGHGITDFIRRSPDSYLPDISLTQLKNGKPQNVRDGKAFWQHCSEHGTPVTILRCPVTFPPEPVNGVMLAGMGVPDLLGTQGTFTFFSTRDLAGKDVGGQIVKIENRKQLTLQLPGPNRAKLTGAAVQTSTEIHVDRQGDSINIKLHNQTCTLKPGQWSPWLRVSFKVGALKKVHGIVQLLVVSDGDEFELYASPVSIDPEKPYTPLSHPSGFSKELAKAIGPYSTRGMPFDTWGLNEGRISEKAFLQHAEMLLEENLQIMRYSLDRCRSGVFYAYFEYPDIMQHMYWRFRDSQHPLFDPAADEKKKTMVDTVYKRMDAIVGELLAQMKDGDKLLVFSDHGFSSFRRSANINAWLRNQGYMVLNNPVGGDMFVDVDWESTKAYALGFGGIYINQKGREPNGTVSVERKHELMDEIAAALLDWEDPRTGERPVNHVYRSAEIFKGKHAAKAPDLYIGFKRGYRASWQTALGAAPAQEFEDNRKPWSGTHLIDPALVPGILFSNIELPAESPGLEDLAPTILRLTDIPATDVEAMGMDGKSLVK